MVESRKRSYLKTKEEKEVQFRYWNREGEGVHFFGEKKGVRKGETPSHWKENFVRRLFTEKMQGRGKSSFFLEGEGLGKGLLLGRKREKKGYIEYHHVGKALLAQEKKGVRRYSEWIKERGEGGDPIFHPRQRKKYEGGKLAFTLIILQEKGGKKILS